MTKFYTDDYGLPPGALNDKYRASGEHPGYAIDVWRLSVYDGDTLHGYWTWVRGRLQVEEDEPAYTQEELFPTNA